jgi:hypothetical protein
VSSSPAQQIALIDVRVIFFYDFDTDNLLYRDAATARMPAMLAPPAPITIAATA